MRRRRALLAAFGVAVVSVSAAIALVIGSGGRRAEGEHLPQQPPLLRGGDFTLTSANGPVSLLSLRGKVVLIYFGYASCPDACPSTLAAIAQGLAQLAAEERQLVRVLFVSVDPARDNPHKLKQYVAHFAPEMIGVTGTPRALAEVVVQYGAAFHMQPVESAVGYVVDHSSFTSVVAPDGRLVEQLPHGTSPQAIAAAVRRWLR